MSSKEPDRIDLKIMDVLQQDARITNQELAARIPLSPSACLRRLRSLEAKGLITGYRALIAVDRIRSATIVLMQVAFKSHALHEFTAFDACIKAMPEVVEAFRTSGVFDYQLRVVVDDMHGWKRIARILLEGPYGIEKIVSQFLVDEVKPFSGYPLMAKARKPGG